MSTHENKLAPDGSKKKQNTPAHKTLTNLPPWGRKQMFDLTILLQWHWCRKTVEQTPEISSPAPAPGRLLFSLSDVPDIRSQTQEVWLRRATAGFLGRRDRFQMFGKSVTTSSAPERGYWLPTGTCTGSRSTSEHTQQQVCARASAYVT